MQHKYFENSLISKCKSKDMLLWRKGYAFVTLEKGLCFCFHRKWKAVNSFWVKKSQVWSRKTPWKILWWEQIVQIIQCFRGSFLQFLWVLHPEWLQSCCLRWSRLTEFSSEDLIIILNFLRVPQRLPVLPINRK